MVEHLFCTQGVVGSSPASGYGLVAQLVEHRIVNPKRAGSIPAESFKLHVLDSFEGCSYKASHIVQLYDAVTWRSDD